MKLFAGKQLSGSSDYIIKRIFFTTLVVMLVNEITSSVAVLVDGIILARALDMYSIAAHGLCSPYMNVIKFIVCFLATGTQVSCARATAVGKINQANSIFTVSSLFAAFISLLFGFLITVFASPIAVFLGAGSDGANLVKPTADYLRGLAIGLPVTLGTSFLISIVTLNNDKKRVTWAVSTMMITNIIGDLANVFIFKGGMFGMALATTVSYLFSFVILALHFRKPTGIRLSFSNLRLSLFKDVAKVGFLPMVTRMFSMVRAYAMNIIFTTYASTAALAANTLVQSNIKVLFICLAAAIGSTTLIMTGMLYGEKDRRGIYQMFRTVLFICFTICTALAALVFAIAPQIASLFGAGEHIQLTVQALRIFMIGFPFIALKMFYIYYFQASLNKNLSLYSSAMGEMVFLTVSAFVLASQFGMTGLFFAYPVSEMLYLVSLFIIMCIRKKHIPRCFDDFLFLDSDFEVPDKDMLDITLNSMNEVVTVSQLAYNFCKEHGLSRRDCFVTSLSIEELAGNIIEHGIDRTKKQYVDIKVILTDGHIIIRLRDNCRPFNPSERAEMFDPNDLMKNIGIRLMFKEVTAIDYSNILGLNNLIITV